MSVYLTAVVGKPRWSLAWCDQCADGYRGITATAQRWADKHMRERHGVTA